MTDRKIINLADVRRHRRPDEIPVTRPGKFCRHKLACVIKEQREVRCSECDAVMDPFDQLIKICNKLDRLEHGIRVREKVMIDVDQKLADKQRELKNLKARIARAKKQLKLL